MTILLYNVSMIFCLYASYMFTFSVFNSMDEASFKDEISVLTDVAKPIHVSGEGPVGRFVTPPL